MTRPGAPHQYLREKAAGNGHAGVEPAPAPAAPAAEVADASAADDAAEDAEP